MSALDQRAPASYRSFIGRPLGCAAGVALAAAIEFLVQHIAPEAPAVLGLGLAGLAGLAIVALAFTLEDQALPILTQAALAGVGLTIVCALSDPEARLRLISFASAAFGVGLAVMLACTSRRRVRVSLGAAALFVAALAGLSAYAAVLVLASRDLMIADFMTYRGIAIMVARLADAGTVRRVQRLAVKLVGQHGDRPVILRAGDAARALFARDQAALAVAGVAVGEVGWLAEHTCAASRDVVGHQPVVRDVAEDQSLLVAEPYRPLGPDAAGPDAHPPAVPPLYLAKRGSKTSKAGSG
jgi:hypothetical protein